MPGNEPKAHHFVQQKYLEAFCDPVPHEKTGASALWVYSGDRPVRRQIPKECAVENYFYCFENQEGERSWVGEHFLADLESASSDVLRTAQQGTLPTTLRDRFTLTGYVAMSLVRTPLAKKHIDRTTIEQQVQQIRDLINDPERHAEFCTWYERETGEKMDPEESIRKLRGGRVRATQTSRAWSLRMMVESLLRFQKRFMSMHLILLHANGGYFLTSDSPVSVFDPETAAQTPEGYVSFQMLFPLSREYCLAGTILDGPNQIEFDAKEVRNVNNSVIAGADRHVYSPFRADYIQSKLEESLAEKNGLNGDGIIRF
jgi:hypothetical protein